MSITSDPRLGGNSASVRNRLVAHAASAGHAINLQEGSDTAVWFSLPWSAELYTQAIARFARQGQRGTVTVHVMLSCGYIDEIAHQVVHQRLADQERLIEALGAGSW